MRYGKRDSVEKPIVRDLRRLGFSVWLLDDFDALIRRGGRLEMVDFKSPGGKPTEQQLRIIAAGFPLRFCGTLEEVLALFGERVAA